MATCFSCIDPCLSTRHFAGVGGSRSPSSAGAKRGKARFQSIALNSKALRAGLAWRRRQDPAPEFKDDVGRLSHVGRAAYDVLESDYKWHQNECWNVTSGKVVSEVKQTPCQGWTKAQDFTSHDAHDEWFPKEMFDLMLKTRQWLDITSLGPPDGQFLERITEAIGRINDTAKMIGVKQERPIIIRMLFGNIIGMPVNCTKLIKDLTSGIKDPGDARIQLWVGAWRKGLSWNHAKIFAVDGKHLLTGGHNLWDRHYLRKDPVHDVSMELMGPVTHDGHLFANKMWQFIEKTQTGCLGTIIDQLPDFIPVPSWSHVIISEFPEGIAETFPPMYKKPPGHDRGDMPMISMGRYGSLLAWDRPSDKAIVAMFNKAQKIIHMALQDIGPPAVQVPDHPNLKAALPGLTWPREYLTALGWAIYDRGVDVEIALSNPGAIPDGLSVTEACYGNGWSCADVASEIIKAVIAATDSKIDDQHLRRMVKENLRVCYIKHNGRSKWGDGQNMGMHAKHFIIDDQAYYMGSQNLYVCDLAEWGVLIDDQKQTEKVMKEYWTPMWKSSYDTKDCNVDEVMNGLGVERDGKTLRWKSQASKREAARNAVRVFGAGNYYHN